MRMNQVVDGKSFAAFITGAADDHEAREFAERLRGRGPARKPAATRPRTVGRLKAAAELLAANNISSKLLRLALTSARDDAEMVQLVESHLRATRPGRRVRVVRPVTDGKSFADFITR
jgi:hypothetical protein